MVSTRQTGEGLAGHKHGKRRRSLGLGRTPRNTRRLRRLAELEDGGARSNSVRQHCCHLHIWLKACQARCCLSGAYGGADGRGHANYHCLGQCQGSCPTALLSPSAALQLLGMGCNVLYVAFGSQFDLQTPLLLVCLYVMAP